jgi:hypothetical protein
MKRVSSTWLCAMLGLSCYRGGDDVAPRQAGDLKAEYEAQQQQIAQCLQDFSDCANAAADPAAIGACADDLQSCLGGGIAGSESDGGSESGGSESGGSESGGTDSGGSESGGSESGGDDGAGDDCEPLLDQCLADPANFDPTCLDGYEACVQGEVDAELQELCDELEAECQALGIPNFDCSSVCP